MNVSLLLRLPRYGSAFAGRRLFVFAFALEILAMLILAFVALVFQAGTPSWASRLADILFFMSELWLSFFVLSGNAMLWVQAHRLRIPRLARDAVMSLLCYAALGVVVPAIVISMFGTPFASTLVLIGLFFATGLLFALLPSYCSVVLWILLGQSWRFVRDPFFAHAGNASLTWSLPTLMLVVAIVLLRWRTLVRVFESSTSMWSMPFFSRVNQQSVMRCSGRGDLIGSTDPSLPLRTLPAWMLPHVSIRSCRPGDSTTNLRVILGNMFSPLTPAGYVMRDVWLVMLSLGFVCCAVLHLRASAAAYSAWYDVCLIILSGFAFFGAMAVSIGAVNTLYQRWRRPDAELSLLALLPAVSTAAVKRNLLLAISRALCVPLLCLFTMQLAALLLFHLRAGAWLLTTLCFIGNLGLMYTLALSVMGGTPPRRWLSILLFGFASTLLSDMPFLIMSMTPNSTFTIQQPWLSLLALAWILLFVILIGIGLRGGRGLARRPHPFLPN